MSSGVADKVNKMVDIKVGAKKFADKVGKCSMSILYQCSTIEAEALGIADKDFFLEMLRHMLESKIIELKFDELPDVVTNNDIIAMYDREWPQPGPMQDLEIMILIEGNGRMQWLKKPDIAM